MKILTPFLLLLLVASLVVIVNSKRVLAGLPGHEELNEDETDHVPHPDDSPEMNTELSCHACSYSVRLMQGAMEKVRTEFERQPHKLKEYHALAAVEDVCKKNKLHVGLLSKAQDEVTTNFIHEVEAKQTNAGQHVLKGGWVTRFFYQQCEDMMTIAEDHMGEMMQGKEVNLCPSCKKFEKLRDAGKTHTDRYGKKGKRGGASKKKKTGDL